MERLVPKSKRGEEAYWYMKQRKQDAQNLFDRAVKAGANLEEALGFASRQIRAAMHARSVYLEELRKERKLEELERIAADKRLRERREEEWLEADQGEAEKAKPFELSPLARKVWFNSERYQDRIT